LKPSLHTSTGGGSKGGVHHHLDLLLLHQDVSRVRLHLVDVLLLHLLDLLHLLQLKRLLLPGELLLEVCQRLLLLCDLQSTQIVDEA
jgi:hypothetical protein